jgi:hypothetical protein
MVTARTTYLVNTGSSTSMKKYNLKRLSDLRIVHTVQNLSVKMQCDILPPINKSHSWKKESVH